MSNIVDVSFLVSVYQPNPEYLKEIPELCDKPIYTLDWEEKTELLIARCSWAEAR